MGITKGRCSGASGPTRTTGRVPSPAPPRRIGAHPALVATGPSARSPRRNVAVPEGCLRWQRAVWLAPKMMLNCDWATNPCKRWPLATRGFPPPSTAAAPIARWQQIAIQLGAMRECTPRRGTRWHASSVKHLLERAARPGRHSGHHRLHAAGLGSCCKGMPERRDRRHSIRRHRTLFGPRPPTQEGRGGTTEKRGVSAASAGHRHSESRMRPS
jgi:hypothetical protein